MYSSGKTDFKTFFLKKFTIPFPHGSPPLAHFKKYKEFNPIVLNRVNSANKMNKT